MSRVHNLGSIIDILGTASLKLAREILGAGGIHLKNPCTLKEFQDKFEQHYPQLSFDPVGKGVTSWDFKEGGTI